MMEVSARGAPLQSKLALQPDISKCMEAQKPHAQAKLLSPTEKCKICGEQAAKHVHYGAMTCFSCRAFFRRSIQNKTATTYACRRNKCCEICLKTRKNCQFCRYNKCIDVGMKPTWVLTSEERERRFRKARDKRHTHEEEHDEANSHDEEHGLPEDVQREEQEQHQEEQQQREEQQQQRKEHQEQEEQKPLLDNVLPRKLDCAVFNHLSRRLSESAKDPSDGLEYSKNTYRLVFSSPNNTVFNNCQIKNQTQEVDSNVGRIHVPFNENLSKNVQVKEETSFPEPTVMPLPPHTQSNYRTSIPSSVIVHSNLPQLYNNVGFPVLENNALDFLKYPVDDVKHSVNFGNSDITDFAHIIDSPFYNEEKSCHLSSPLGDVGDHHMAAATRRCDSYAASSASEIQSGSSDADQCEQMDESFYTSSDDDADERRRVQNNLTYWNPPEIRLRDDETALFQRLVDNHNQHFRSVNFGEDVLKEMIMCSMFRIPISTGAVLIGYRLSVERIRVIMESLDLFNRLCVVDRKTLLTDNVDLIVSMRAAIFFDTQKTGAQQVMMSMGSDDVTSIQRQYSQLLKDDCRLKRIDYTTFNSVQNIEENTKAEDRYSFLQRKVGALLNEELIEILLTYIIVLTSDCSTLVNKPLVDQAQDHYITLLHRYIYSLYPRNIACVRLAATMDILTAIREMADIKRTRSMNVDIRRNTVQVHL